jgi:glycosyltransferase involved in cell wall biosynthesis
MMRPTVNDIAICVVIAARNAQGTVARAASSALAQDHVREVIVVDDASTDQTASAASSADDGSGRLCVMVQRQNLGPAGARNRALACSEAPFFCVLDADDYMLPGRLARLIASGGEWDLLADDIVILPQEAQLGVSLRHNGDPGSGRVLDAEAFVLGNISRAGRPRAELGFLKPVVSRAFMRRHALAYDDEIRLGEDYAFYLRALLHGAIFRLVSACGYVAVERSDSLSARHCAGDLRRLAAFDEAILRAYPAMPAAQRRAIGRHRAATWSKFVYAAALETKQAHGFASGLAYLARSPAALPHVFGQTLRAKAGALRRRLIPGFVPEPNGLRFLVGLPNAQFAAIGPHAALEDQRSAFLGSAPGAGLVMEMTRQQWRSPESAPALEALTGRPDISFIVATYNAAPFVRQAIQSALDQRGATIEIVVADDASTDDTPDIVQAMARNDPRIRLLRRTANGGPSAARNQAMAEARGHWLAILDGDDLVLPERGRRLLDLAALSSADVIADNFERFSGEDEAGGGTMIPRGAEPYAFTVNTASFLRANCAFGSSRFALGAVKGMFRAEFLKAHGITHREGLDFGEDFLFCLQCLMAGGRFVVTSEVFYKYRKHRGSQSWRMKASHLEQLRRAIAEEGLSGRFSEAAGTAAAEREFVASFENAHAFVKVVDLAQQRRIGEALARIAVQPEIWPLVLRYGGAAALNRVKSRLPGRPGSERAR